MSEERAMKKYKTINGTSYDVRTPDEVVAILENARQTRTRLHVSLGDSESGRDWIEENMVHGVIGRSTGSIKIPLLIHNRRSVGGPGLLDHCIVRIRTSRGGRILWQHDKYSHGTLEIRQKTEPVTLPDGRTLTVDVLCDGELHASFEDMQKARRWVHKLGVIAPIAA
jgi:hypothetical protein